MVAMVKDMCAGYEYRIVFGSSVSDGEGVQKECVGLFCIVQIVRYTRRHNRSGTVEAVAA